MCVCTRACSRVHAHAYLHKCVGIYMYVHVRSGVSLRCRTLGALHVVFWDFLWLRTHWIIQLAQWPVSSKFPSVSFPLAQGLQQLTTRTDFHNCHFEDSDRETPRTPISTHTHSELVYSHIFFECLLHARLSSVQWASLGNMIAKLSFWGSSSRQRTAERQKDCMQPSWRCLLGGDKYCIDEEERTEEQGLLWVPWVSTAGEGELSNASHSM